MKIDELTLGEIKQITQLLGSSNEPRVLDPKGALRIVILQRGWVVVGNVFLDGAEYRIENAKVIRIWGTTRGLGEIALNGPTNKTILDDAGIVNCHTLAVVAQIHCVEAKWK